MTTKELEKIVSENAKQIAEVWALFRDTDKKINKLTDKWGRFVESFLAPGIPEVFQERGFPIHRTYQRAKATLQGERMEIDILGVNDEYVLLVEVKSTLGVDDVKQHLKHLEKFKAFFPEYKDRKAIGAMAGIEITGEADKFAYQAGLFVLGQAGENVTILNDEKFKPKVW